MRHVKLLSFSTVVCVSVASLSVLGSPALAKGRPILVNAPAEEVVTRHIGYADLNLAAAAGEQALMGRVDSAVNVLCDEAQGGRDRSFMFNLAQTRCVRATWEQARPQIDLALQRAREIASTGKSSIAAAALTIAVPAER